LHSAQQTKFFRTKANFLEETNMCKKTICGGGLLLLVGVLIFGSNSLGYLQTAFSGLRQRANDAVPVAFQIENAQNQLEKIDPEIKDMIWQIAKEKSQVKKLAAQVASSESELDKQYREMLTLREHMANGDRVYVATNGQAYSTERVKEDLAHRFKMYQTAEKTLVKSKEILSIRNNSLEAAEAKLEEAKSQKRELEVAIENLVARQKMNEVVATTMKLNIDNSQLSKARKMLEDIDARLSAEEEMMNLLPRYSGQIPVGTDAVETAEDLLDNFDAYFKKDKPKSEDDLVVK